MVAPRSSRVKSSGSGPDGWSERTPSYPASAQEASPQRDAAGPSALVAGALARKLPRLYRMTTPDLHLRTLWVLDGSGRISGTREPSASPAPLFCLVRGAEICVWAVGAGVPDGIADQIDALARDEPPISDFRAPPLHAERYASLLPGSALGGPAFTFPDALPDPGDVDFVDDLRPLERHFTGWEAEEIPGCLPIAAVLEDGYAVSACFCARRSDVAAEAGLETAEPYRGRGLGPRVTVAWALAIRESGRTPLYSTSWANDASLAVARKLGLHTYASSWSIHT